MGPLLVALTLALAPPGPGDDEPARSLDASIALVGEALPPCLAHDAIVEQVRAWTELDQLNARLAIEIRAVPGAEDSVDIWIGRDGEELLDRRFGPLPSACPSANAAVGLALAIALDSTLLGALASAEVELEPSVSPEAAITEPESEPVDAVETPVDTSPAQPRSIGLTSALRLQVGPSVGAPVELGVGAQASSVFVVHRWVRLRLGTGVVAGRRSPLAAGRVSAVLVDLRFDVCVGERPKATPELRVEGCIGVLGGPVLASGSGFDQARRDFAGLFGLTGDFVMSVFPTRRIGLALDLELLVPLLRPRFALADPETGALTLTRATPVLGGALLVGPVVRF